MDEKGLAELDSHADNCVLGRDAVILEEYIGKTYKIVGYDKRYSVTKNMVKACLVYEADEGGRYLLVFDQVFVDKRMECSLLCPNQMREHGVKVDDLAKRYGGKHEIIAGNLSIPLVSKGYLSAFKVSRPSEEDIDTLERIEMTGENWDPYSEDHVTLEGVSVVSTKASSPFDACVLADKWLMSEAVARNTLAVTTLLAVRHYNEPRYSSYNHRFRYLTRKRIAGRFWTDTFFAEESHSNNICAQIFVNEYRYVLVIPLRTKSDAPAALRMFLDNVGLPEVIVSDNAKEQRSMEWKRILREFGVKDHPIEAYKYWQNYAENGVKMVKFRAAKIMEQKAVPGPLWDHVLEYCSNLSNRCFHKVPRLDGRTPYEFVHGMTPDISAFVEFGFYDIIFYTIHPKPMFPNPKRKIGRWLGPSKSIHCDLSFKILTRSGNVIVTSAVEPVSETDHRSVGVKNMIKDLDDAITSLFYDKPGNVFIDEGTLSNMIEDDDDDMIIVRTAVGGGLTDVGVVTEESHTALAASNHEVSASAVSSEQVISVATVKAMSACRGWETAKIRIGSKRGVVKKRKSIDSSEGDNNNPLLDQEFYLVDFGDTVEELQGNKIAEAIYRAVDDDGFGENLRLSEILDHFVSRRHVKERSTQGWSMRVRWTDNTESVVRLKELKETYPVEVAQYAKDNHLVNEEAFNWWVGYTLKKSERIMAKVKARLTRSEKYGITIPRTVKEAITLDQSSGTHYWADAMEKELKNIEVAFEVLGKGERAPDDYQLVRCHFVFDVKFDGTRKARYVAGGHMVDPPSAITYSSVASRDSIRILLVIAALNDLKVNTCDIQNAYINAKPRERVYFIAGPEFKGYQGRVVLVVRALYGLKSSGAAFRSHLSEALTELGYKSSLGDADVYLKDMGTHYDYVVCYVDDILCISRDPSIFMQSLQTIFKLKDGYGIPNMFLGMELIQFGHVSGRRDARCWGLASKEYVCRALREIQEKTIKFGFRFPTKRCYTPLHFGYDPSLDLTDEIEDEKVINWFQGMIGILRWLVEIGRIDIGYAVSVLSSYSSNPRVGHIQECLRVFKYLQDHNNQSLVLDPTTPSEGLQTLSHQCDWVDFYPDARENIPHNAPKPRGRSIVTFGYVDADWAGSNNRRSHTGFIIYVQSAPVLWYSKKQSTIETSTYGAELCATRICLEAIEGLRYKLRMFGIPFSGPTILYGDNQSVIHSLTRPESTLKKKHNAIAFHRCREAAAANIVAYQKVESQENTADILTKTLTAATTEYHSESLSKCDA